MAVGLIGDERMDLVEAVSETPPITQLPGDGQDSVSAGWPSAMETRTKCNWPHRPATSSIANVLKFVPLVSNVPSAAQFPADEQDTDSTTAK